MTHFWSQLRRLETENVSYFLFLQSHMAFGTVTPFREYFKAGDVIKMTSPARKVVR